MYRRMFTCDLFVKNRMTRYLMQIEDSVGFYRLIICIFVSSIFKCILNDLSNFQAYKQVQVQLCCGEVHKIMYAPHNYCVTRVFFWSISIINWIHTIPSTVLAPVTIKINILVYRIFKFYIRILYANWIVRLFFLFFYSVVHSRSVFLIYKLYSMCV